ncbi:hypothetical protein HYPSUDRAFT_31922 [Hypholoma sublateritium FD-334 SS-4]|uniref:Uncharacterized protein n=1 Tax=Hypholoma sublateritium (strain FD-334 SS-4) TaxID=945553 RepID=A0A0D2N0H8_HYPSF|nr:hypothetical protein HYPSUDRAFT_31922 [Hypholoma sublateritium FD-334 SS-4]
MVPLSASENSCIRPNEIHMLLRSQRVSLCIQTYSLHLQLSAISLRRFDAVCWIRIDLATLQTLASLETAFTILRASSQI